MHQCLRTVSGLLIAAALLFVIACSKESTGPVDPPEVPKPGKNDAPTGPEPTLPEEGP